MLHPQHVELRFVGQPDRGRARDQHPQGLTVGGSFGRVDLYQEVARFASPVDSSRPFFTDRDRRLLGAENSVWGAAPTFWRLSSTKSNPDDSFKDRETLLNL